MERDLSAARGHRGRLSPLDIGEAGVSQAQTMSQTPPRRPPRPEAPRRVYRGAEGPNPEITMPSIDEAEDPGRSIDGRGQTLYGGAAPGRVGRQTAYDNLEHIRYQ